MTILTHNDKVELQDTLYDAQEKLFEAIEILENYVNQTDDQNAKAYLVDHLKIMASSNHGFIAEDLNIEDLITEVMFTTEE